jgi:hypothetical protein
LIEVVVDNELKGVEDGIEVSLTVLTRKNRNKTSLKSYAKATGKPEYFAYLKQSFPSQNQIKPN